MPNISSWHSLFMDIAYRVSKQSKDPNTKVGAVIVSPDNRELSFGYNGFARKLPETMELWNDREIKLKLVVHAEMNAVFNCPFDSTGCKIYVTHQPCSRCLIHLINAGISEVYYSEPYTKLGDEDITEMHKKLFKTYQRIRHEIR